MENISNLEVSAQMADPDVVDNEASPPSHQDDVREFVSKDRHLKISHHLGYLKNSLVFLLAISLLFSLLFVEKIGYWAPILFLTLYVIHISITIYVQVIMRSNTSANLQLPASIASSLHNSQSFLHSMRSSAMQVNYNRWNQFFENLKLITEWDEKSAFQKFLFVLRFPIEIVGIVSIPPMLSPEDLDFDSVYLPWCLYFYRIRLVTFPWITSLFGILAFRIEGSLAVWVTYFMLAMGVSIVLWLTSSWKKPPVYEPLIVLFAFATCIVWFYVISNELVSILNTLGIVCKISPSILGIAILAIGNTLGDLISNIVISRNGGFETALTACISAPSQNILLSLGVAILKTLVVSGRDLQFASKTPDSDLIFSFIVLVVILLAVPFIIIASNYKVPRNLGWILLFTYVIYLPISIKLSSS